MIHFKKRVGVRAFFFLHVLTALLFFSLFTHAVSNDNNEAQIFLLTFQINESNETENNTLALLSPLSAEQIILPTIDFFALIHYEEGDNASCVSYVDDQLLFENIIPEQENNLSNTRDLQNGAHNWSVSCTIFINNEKSNNQTISNSSTFFVNTTFQVTPDKTLYEHEETVIITFEAPAQATGEAIVLLPGQTWGYVLPPLTGPYPLEIPFVFTTDEGEYTIVSTFDYFQEPLQINETFTVKAEENDDPPVLDISFKVNESDPKKNENILFTIDLINANGSTSMTLKYGDSSEDTYTGTADPHTFTHAYTSTGTYTASVTVNNNNQEVQKSLSIDVTELDTSNPVITLLGPANNAVVTQTTATFSYSVQETSSFECGLYFYEELEGNPGFYDYTIESLQKNLKSDTTYSFTKDKLTEKNYIWTIGCEDNSGNSVFSEERTLTVDLSSTSANTNENQEVPLRASNDDDFSDVDTTIGEINDVITNFKSKGFKEIAIIEKLGFLNLLEEKRTELKKIERDISNLKFRRDYSESEKEEQRIKLLNQIETVRSETPRDFTVQSTDDYVKYDISATLEEVAKAYVEKKNLKFSDKKIETFSEIIVDVQKHLSVDSSSNVIDFTYLNGKQETLTVVVKEITISDISARKVLEVIPKSVASSVSDIDIRNEFSVIQEDPIIELDVQEQMNLIYLIKGNINTEEIKKTDTLLILDPNTIADYESTTLSGFSIFNKLTPNEDALRGIMAFLLLILLTGAVVFFKYKETITQTCFHPKVLFDKEQQKKIANTHQVITTSNSHLNEGNYEDSSKKYKEALLQYKMLNEVGRKHIKSKLLTLHDNIDYFYINHLLDEAFEKVKTDPNIAQHNYQRVQALYKNIPKSNKRIVQQRCMQLHKQLQELNHLT